MASFSEYQIEIAEIGIFSLVEYNNEEDAEIIHPWVNMEYAKFWMLNNSTLEKVKSEYKTIMAPIGTKVYLGYLDNSPMFLTEIYDPACEEIAEHYLCKPGDFGMHILVAPAKKYIPKFTQCVFKVLLNFLFQYRGAKRVIVEPDVANFKIHKLNEQAGFKVFKDSVKLSNKVVRIEICEVDDFHQSKLME